MTSLAQPPDTQAYDAFADEGPAGEQPSAVQGTISSPVDVPPVPTPPDATAEMPAVPDSSRQVFAGASLRSLAQRFNDRSDLSEEETARRRAIIAVIVAGAAAFVIVLTVVIIALAGDNGDQGANAEQEAPAPVALGGSATITAPATAPDSVDWAGNPVSYGTTNLTDGESATAWRMEGDGSGTELTISWDAPRTISEVGLINGYAKVDPERENYNWYDINRRVAHVTWIFDDGTEVTQTLSETTQMQTMTLDEPIETSSMRLRLDEVTAPGGRDYTALSEITISGT